MVYDFEKWMEKGRELSSSRFYQNKLFITGEFVEIKKPCPRCGCETKKYNWSSEYCGNVKMHINSSCTDCDWSDE